MIHEKFGAEQQGIPGKRGATLIGRIFRPCGAQGQYAPKLLLRFRQKIDEAPAFQSQIPYAEPAGQRGQM